jgi:hypothetical protein
VNSPLVLLVMVLPTCNQSMYANMFSINQLTDRRSFTRMMLSSCYQSMRMLLFGFNQKSISAAAARDGALLLQSINFLVMVFSSCNQSISICT